MLIRVARFLADLPTVKFIALQSISFAELSDLLTSQPNVLSCRLKSDETLVERTGPAASFFSRTTAQRSAWAQKKIKPFEDRLSR